MEGYESKLNVNFFNIRDHISKPYKLVGCIMKRNLRPTIKECWYI